MNELTIVLNDNRFSTPLRDGTVTSDEISLRFIEVGDLIQAFDSMAMNQSFDICEMALVTALQARALNKPVMLLPSVRAGGIPYDRLRYWPANGHLEPSQLRGKRLGVRSYSQTLALWVRGILFEEEGIGYGDLEWVTTEDSRIKAYADPSFVTRAPKGRGLDELLREGEIAATVGPDVEGSAFIYPDPEAAQWAWYERHRTLGINHVVTVRTQLVEQEPELVNEAYRMLYEAHRIATASDPTPDPSALPSPMVFGVESMRTGLKLAFEYALEQRVLPSTPKLEELFPRFLLDT